MAVGLEEESRLVEEDSHLKKKSKEKCREQYNLGMLVFCYLEEDMHQEFHLLTEHLEEDSRQERPLEEDNLHYIR